MKKIDDIEARAIAALTPGADEAAAMARAESEIVRRVRAAASGVDGVAGVAVGGSYAKGTWLPASGADIDVFVAFADDVPDAAFRRDGEDIGRRALAGYDHHVRYTEHPYVEGFVGGVRVNVVPHYEAADGKLRSAADRSPRHTKFIRSELGAAGAVQARLLKRFAKTAGIYGASQGVRGFSGYVLEVAVQGAGGSFRAAVERFAGIRRGGVIGGTAEAAKKFDTPIVILDPVDPGRNLAAAISGENIARIISASRRYLDAPSDSFFAADAAAPEHDIFGPGYDGIGGVVTAVFTHAAADEGAVDRTHGRVQRAAASFSRILAAAGFAVARIGTSVDAEAGTARARFVLAGGTTVISPGYIREGPPIFDRVGADAFERAVSRDGDGPVFVDDASQRLRAHARRRHTDAVEFLDSALRGANARAIPDGLAFAGVSAGQ